MSKYKLVVDLEATCCANNEFPRYEMEIIEIGAVLLDSENKTVSTFQTFVKPIIQPVLTDFCKELTTITQDQVDTAPSFNVAMTSFLNWLHEHVIAFYDFYSWVILIKILYMIYILQKAQKRVNLFHIVLVVIAWKN